MKKFLIVLMAVLALAAVLVSVGCVTQPKKTTGGDTTSDFEADMTYTIDSSYNSESDWGASAGVFTIKFLFVADADVAAFEAAPGDSGFDLYVYGDSTVGNGSVTIADLSTTTAYTPEGYDGVQIKLDSNGDFEVAMDLSGLADTLQDKDGSTEVDAQAASLVATGYEVYMLGSVTYSADASGDAHALPAQMWGTYVLKFDALATVATYDVTLTQGANGTMTADMTTDIESGTEVTITTTPDAGYRVATFTVGGTDQKTALLTGTANEYKFNITADTTVVVTYEELPTTTYVLDLTTDVNGSIASDQTNDSAILDGTIVAVTCTPDAGYRVATFTVDTVDKKADLVSNVYTFTISADTAIDVTYELIPTFDVWFNVLIPGDFDDTTQDIIMTGNLAGWAAPDIATAGFGQGETYNLDVSSDPTYYSVLITGIEENTTVLYKYCSNYSGAWGATWASNEWGGDPNRSLDVSADAATDDIYGTQP